MEWEDKTINSMQLLADINQVMECDIIKHL